MFPCVQVGRLLRIHGYWLNAQTATNIEKEEDEIWLPDDMSSRPRFFLLSFKKSQVNEALFFEVLALIKKDSAEQRSKLS